MREIKFRVWDTALKEMFYPNKDGIIECYKATHVMTFDGRVVVQHEGRSNLWILSDGIEIMQYTGLKDNTNWEQLTEKERKEWLVNHIKEEWAGKEIYDGDIVQNKHGQIGAVVFQAPIFHIVTPKRAEWALESTAVIVGNIYENPELLK